MHSVASAARGDRNLDPPVVPQSAEQPLREGVITLYFPGPLNSYHIDLYIANGSSFSVEMIVIDGSVVMPNHIIWDSFGTFEGPATLMALVGEDTQTVTATFVGFDPGETCRFDTLHPDFPNQPNVAVVQLAGVACTVFADGCGAEGVFAVEGNNVVVEPRARASGRRSLHLGSNKMPLPMIQGVPRMLDARVEPRSSQNAIGMKIVNARGRELILSSKGAVRITKGPTMRTLVILVVSMALVASIAAQDLGNQAPVKPVVTYPENIPNPERQGGDTIALARGHPVRPYTTTPAPPSASLTTTTTSARTAAATAPDVVYKYVADRRPGP